MSPQLGVSGAEAPEIEVDCGVKFAGSSFLCCICIVSMYMKEGGQVEPWWTCRKKRKSEKRKEKKGQQSWYLVDPSGHKNCQ